MKRKKLATSELNLLEKNYDYTAFDLKMDVREANDENFSLTDEFI